MSPKCFNDMATLDGRAMMASAYILLAPFFFSFLVSAYALCYLGPFFDVRFVHVQAK